MGKQKMTRKKLVEHIKQNMPSDLNEIGKLAFIEYEVAKQISFDEQYLWGNKETKEKIYRLAAKETRRPSNEIKRKLICVNMAELFGYIAQEFGYNVKYQKRVPGNETKTGDKNIFKTLSDIKQEHVCPVVGLSNGKFIEVDIQADLSRLQTHSKPKAFGADIHANKNGVSIGRLEESLIEETFRKIYQLKGNERFTDEYIMLFSTMLRYQGRTPIQMIEFFMGDPKIESLLQNARCIEANKLYKAILKACYDINIDKQFFKEEHKAIIEECILSNDKGEKRYSFCIYAEDGEQKVLYIYSKKTRRMVNLSQEEIQQMTGQLGNVQLRGRPSELKNNMISFINGECKNSTQAKTVTSLEDIFLDENEEEL